MKIVKSFSISIEAVSWLEEQKRVDAKFNASEFIDDVINAHRVKDEASTGLLTLCGTCGAEFSSVLRACPGCAVQKIKSDQAVIEAAKQAESNAQAEAEAVPKRSAEAAKQAARIADAKETETRLRSSPELFEKLELLIASLPDMEKVHTKNYVDLIQEYSDKKIRVGSRNVVAWIISRELAAAQP